jgi:hypothetical protein
MNDFCPTKIVSLEVQENGIIRTLDGNICARLVDDFEYAQLPLPSKINYPGTVINEKLTPPQGTPTTAHELAALLLQCPEGTLVNVIANNYAYPFTITYGGGGDSEGRSTYTTISLYVDALNGFEKLQKVIEEVKSSRTERLHLLGDHPRDLKE